MATNSSLIYYPSGYDASDYSFYKISNSASVIGKGSNNTNYCTIANNKGENYIWWFFDLSSIPEKAIINSVACTLKASVKATGATMTANASLYSGSTLKSSTVSFSQ
jgi:hypothetical protein